MKHVLITSEKMKFLISDEEKKAVVQRLLQKEKFVVLQGEVVPLAIAPTISTFDRWFAQENERLKTYSMKLCKKCLCARHVSERCQCWESDGAKLQHAFGYGNSVKLISIDNTREK